MGVLGLAAMLGDALAYMRGSQDDFIAQQKAEEAAEAIFTANTKIRITWAQISNNSGANPAGLFLVGPSAAFAAGPDRWISRLRWPTQASRRNTILMPGP